MTVTNIALAPRRIREELTFSDSDNFGALLRATKWLEANGYSVGVLQADAPTGILRGPFAISKWRNMSEAEREALDGIMDAPRRTYRTGPVRIRLFAREVQQ
jgi:hypothetical protein